jgi:lysyl-tRNA synthetase class 2
MPDQDLNEILKLRREKLDTLREAGVNPYPYRFEKTIEIPDLLRSFDDKPETVEEEGEGEQFSIAGRLISIRLMGKAAFCHVRDEFGQMQVYVQRDRIGEEAFHIFKLLDISDIVGFRGTTFRTKTGEPTLRALSFELLSKSLRPLPVVKEVEGEKHHAFTDKEARYRQRYIDLAVNPDVRKIFHTRARIISSIREFFDLEGYLEVETPTLQPLYGGALAKPFKTFYNVLDREFYLRIADELYLKRLIAGGFEKVYEICKDFRNEGMDKFHNPEFTMLEFYQAYADFEEIMDLSERMFRHITNKALGTAEVTYQGKTIDFAQPFRRVRFFDLLNEAVGKDLLGMDMKELGEFAKSQGIEVTKQMGEGKILDELMKEKVRPHLIEPTFIYDYPLSLSPLAKKHRKDPRLVERFQPFALGFELGNAFSELNDPLDQRARFEAQRRLKEAGDEETQPIDEDYLLALEYGMPPTGGMGIGVDRLVMLLTDQDQISEVILFPHLSVQRRTEKSIIEEKAKRLADFFDTTLREYGIEYETIREREYGKGKQKRIFDLLIPFKDGFIVVDAKLPNHVTTDYLLDFSESISALKEFKLIYGAVVLIERYEFPPGQLSRLHAEAKDLGISILDEASFETMVLWMQKGAIWILNQNAKRLHRPWCFYIGKIPKPKVMVDDHCTTEYGLSDCCSSMTFDR